MNLLTHTDSHSSSSSGGLVVPHAAHARKDRSLAEVCARVHVRQTHPSEVRGVGAAQIGLLDLPRVYLRTRVGRIALLPRVRDVRRDTAAGR